MIVEVVCVGFLFAPLVAPLVSTCEYLCEYLWGTFKNLRDIESVCGWVSSCPDVFLRFFLALVAATVENACEYL